MSPQMWLENLASYSLQVAVLIGAGTALICLFRLKTPAVLLAFWQVLLVSCLLLPLLQPWRQMPSAVPGQAAVEDAPLTGLTEGKTFAPLPARVTIPFPTYATVIWALAWGVGLRLLWLASGLLRLRRHLNRARRLAALPDSIRDMKWRVGVSAEVLFSSDIDSPVTFGWRRPAVLFPESFAGMSESMQRPIACHELLHVERRDWLFIVAEELLRSLLWFHPGIWWALARIHLSREQVVDREVLRLTGERGAYLESLLHIASLRGRPVAVPAPLLLRERHLVQRVALMLKESKMTKSRLAFSLLMIAAFLLWTGTFAAAWFPLTSPPVPDLRGTVNEAVSAPAPAVNTPGHDISYGPDAAKAPVRGAEPAPDARQQAPLQAGVNVPAPKQISRVDPVYPELAKRAGVEQVVILDVLIDEAGNVADVRILRGHPLLDKAAIDAVRQWRYAPTLLNGQAVPVRASVEVSFKLNSGFVSPSDAPKPARVTAIGGATGGVIGGMPGGVAGGILGGVPPAPPPPPPQQAGGAPIRVGGNVQESKLIKRVDPVYPPLAKQARVEQTVMLEVGVNEQGFVSTVRVIRGHPLLDQAAIDAVKQWVYSPTYMNGAAVPVVATVTVVFSLSTRLTLDADGYLKNSEGATVSINTLREGEGSVLIAPTPQTSFAMIQQTLAYLQAQGVQSVRLSSPFYTFAEGQLFYLASPLAGIPTDSAQAVHAPAIEFSMDQLKALGEAALRTKMAGGNSPGMSTSLSYTLCIDASGRVVAVLGPSGPLEVPEITTALRQTRVTAPGMLGNTPVPTAVRISVPINIR